MGIDKNRFPELFDEDGSRKTGDMRSTPLNTMGMGNPSFPVGIGFNKTSFGSGIGNTGADFHSDDYVIGSGDQL